MRETTAYRGMFIVITCPYCEHVHYLDEEDGWEQPFEEQKVRCAECGKTFVVDER